MKDYEIEMLAKSFLPEIRAFFESEEGRAEYEKQAAEQKIKNITQTAWNDFRILNIFFCEIFCQKQNFAI